MKLEVKKTCFDFSLMTMTSDDNDYNDDRRGLVIAEMMIMMMIEGA